MDNFSSSKEHRGFDWAAFISGILMVIAAILLIRHPGVGLRAFVLIFAILSIYKWRKLCYNDKTNQII